MAAIAQEYCNLHINLEAASPAVNEESAGAKLIKKFSDGFGLKKLSKKEADVDQQHEEDGSHLTQVPLERRTESENAGGSNVTLAVAGTSENHLSSENKEPGNVERSNLVLPSAKLFKKFSRGFAGTKSSGGGRKAGEECVADLNLASEAPTPSTEFPNADAETTAASVQAPAESPKATFTADSSATLVASVAIKPALVDVEIDSLRNNEDCDSASSAVGVLKTPSSGLKVRAASAAITFPQARTASAEPNATSPRVIATTKTVPVGSTETQPFSVKAETAPACTEKASRAAAPAAEMLKKLSSALKWSKRTANVTSGVALAMSSGDQGASIGGPVPLLSISPPSSKALEASSAQDETTQAITAAKVKLLSGLNPATWVAPSPAETQPADVAILAAAAQVQEAAVKVQKAAAIVQTAAAELRAAAVDLQRTYHIRQRPFLSLRSTSASPDPLKLSLSSLRAFQSSNAQENQKNNVQSSGLIKKISDTLNVKRLFKQISSPENGTTFQRVFSPVSCDSSCGEDDHAEEHLESSRLQSAVDGKQARAQKNGRHAALLMTKMSTKFDLRTLGGIRKSGAEPRLPEGASPVNHGSPGRLMNTDGDTGYAAFHESTSPARVEQTGSGLIKMLSGKLHHRKLMSHNKNPTNDPAPDDGSLPPGTQSSNPGAKHPDLFQRGPHRCSPQNR